MTFPICHDPYIPSNGNKKLQEAGNVWSCKEAMKEFVIKEYNKIDCIDADDDADEKAKVGEKIQKMKRMQHDISVRPTKSTTWNHT